MSASKDSKKSHKMTDSERLELAAKLDKELDTFIDGLEKKTYDEGWPEDRWEEEMEKHPFFMSKPPEPGQEISPLMEGLQQLKYGVEDNTPEELASNYKDDGNFNFKHKKYRLAILSYTEGLKVKCGDKEITAQLYNNRAAASYMLKNYRSSLNDCFLAMKHKEDYKKCFNRAIQCCTMIKDYKKCVEMCNQYLKKWPEDELIMKSKTQAVINDKMALRNQRMGESKARKAEKEAENLIEKIKSRNVKLELTKKKNILDLADLEPQVPQISQNRVHFDSEEKLVWPVILMYPEYRQTDFVQNFHEDTVFLEQLEQIIGEPPLWDVQHKYKIGNLNVYFEGENKKSVHKVDINRTLREILQDEKFFVRGGTPSFMIFPVDSDAEKHFLASY